MLIYWAFKNLYIEKILIIPPVLKLPYILIHYQKLIQVSLTNKTMALVTSIEYLLIPQCLHSYFTIKPTIECPGAIIRDSTVSTVYSKTFIPRCFTGIRGSFAQVYYIYMSSYVPIASCNIGRFIATVCLGSERHCLDLVIPHFNYGNPPLSFPIAVFGIFLHCLWPSPLLSAWPPCCISVEIPFYNTVTNCLIDQVQQLY